MNQSSSAQQEQINAALDLVCNTFSGAGEASIGKDCVLAMLFLKYVCDTWQDHHDEYRSKHGDHPELIAELLKTERFELPTEASFQALYARRHEAGNGERIDRALQTLEEANLGKLRHVFENVRFNVIEYGESQEALHFIGHRRNELVRHLLDQFNKPKLDLRPSRFGTPDVIGNACEYLIKKFASSSSKKTAEFYTPPEVSKLMAQLMQPKEGDEICDPTCGSGSLLMACGRSVREQAGSRQYALFGQEANGSTWALAKMNLFLHGEENHCLEWGDTLVNPKLLDSDNALKRFDIVVANPPFNLDKWGLDGAGPDRFGRFRRGLPPRSKADFAFISHMVEAMKPGTGRMAVVVPHGVLFRGAAEGQIRRRLIEENLLDLVIGLPEKLFYGTGIPAAVLVFRQRKADEQTLFIDASRDFESGKNQNLLRSGDLQRILDTVKARQSISTYAHLATFEEISQNDFNLNISRYVDAFEEHAEVDWTAVRRERAQLKAELAQLEEQINGHLKELGYE